MLLRFAVRFVRTAERAELLELETTSGGLLVLGVRVVPILTIRALERDDFSWHDVYPAGLINPEFR
jgi:hypothetical protein